MSTDGVSNITDRGAAEYIKENVLTQKEASKYITKHYKSIDAPFLSRLTNQGAGPDFIWKGNQKLFLKSDLDEWINEQKEGVRAKE